MGARLLRDLLNTDQYQLINLKGMVSNHALFLLFLSRKKSGLPSEGRTYFIVRRCMADQRWINLPNGGQFDWSSVRLARPFAGTGTASRKHLRRYRHSSHEGQRWL